MKRVFLASAFSLLLLVTLCKTPYNLETITISTISQYENNKSGFTVNERDKNTKLVSIQITNNSNQTELIKDINNQLNNILPFGKNSRFLFRGYF